MLLLGTWREVLRYFVYGPTCDQEQQFGSLQEACRCHGYRPLGERQGPNLLGDIRENQALRRWALRALRTVDCEGGRAPALHYVRIHNLLLCETLVFVRR